MTERSALLKEMDCILNKAKSEGGFPETIVLIEEAIRNQEACERLDETILEDEP